MNDIQMMILADIVVDLKEDGTYKISKHRPETGSAYTTDPTAEAPNFKPRKMRIYGVLPESQEVEIRRIHGSVKESPKD